MKKTRIFLLIFCTICISLLTITSCGAKKAPSDTNDPSKQPPIIAEDGVLTSIADGKSPYTPDGRNPSFAGDKVVVYFDFEGANVGLDLDQDTMIHYNLRKSDGTNLSGTSALDTSLSNIKNEYGYIGICFDVNTTFEKYERAVFDLSFTDKNGKEYTLGNQYLCKGLSFLGLDASVFDVYLKNTVETTVSADAILQTATINEKEFTFRITLKNWSEKTSPSQIVTISRLFWQCYPRMHARFGEAADSPLTVILDIEDGGYEIASASGNAVHLHDGWLQQHPNDYDCLTHEFAHVIQNGWDGDFCEYSGYIERFADCCRYLYAFENGRYNDANWELQTVMSENSRESSVRFLVWLDYSFSNNKTDILLNYFTVCRSRKYLAKDWAEAWQEILKDTPLAGQSIEDIWARYAASDFAKLSSHNSGDGSPLENQFKIRSKVK
ncbi:MAG: hypothetical protein E7616_05130 [Ruminococcaceae bacterium]|nr:hypothetical protein [Oscillospiraceae bacterium]